MAVTESTVIMFSCFYILFNSLSKALLAVKDSVHSLDLSKFSREILLKEYTLEENGKVVLISEKTFSTPSSAVTFCLVRNANGWIEWKDKEGQTLDDVYIKLLEG